MENKNGQFALFENKRKEKETHADFQGLVSLDGKEYYVNAWNKKTRNGDLYLSCSMKEKEKK